jgi:predicted acyl esterase
VTDTALRLRFRASWTNPAPLPIDKPFEVTLEFPAAGYRFRAGSAILVYVSSSECGVTVNPQTGGPLVDETSTQAATIRLLFGPSAPSRLILPTR